MNLIDKLLWKENNRWQIFGAAFGAFIGLLLLLIAIQFYQDLSFLTGKGGSKDDRYVIINKKVNFFNTLGANAAFNEEEIEKILQQPFVLDADVFSSNRYKVSASSKMLGFYTELFFEAVPGKFLDVSTRKFEWKEGQNDIPIIISRDYLALYNFGFAPSQGLPQFTPKTIKRVTIDIILRGNRSRKTMQGQIVGFSDRINSIIVPQNFMEWANKNFGDGSSGKSSRLIMEVSNPYAKEFTAFLDENNYEISSGKLIGGQVGTLIALVVGFLAFIGIVIVLLSVLLFVLNFQLLISKSSQSISLLLQLGYKHKQLSQVLTKRMITLFAFVFVGTIIALLLSRYFQVEWFTTQGFELPFVPHWTVILAAILFAALFVIVNLTNIRKNVIALFE